MCGIRCGFGRGLCDCMQQMHLSIEGKGWSRSTTFLLHNFRGLSGLSIARSSKYPTNVLTAHV